MKNKHLLIITCVLLLCFAAAVPVMAGTPKIALDGKALSFEVPPTVENGRTLVPLRAIFEALGASVQWDEATQTVTATKGETTIKLVVGGKAFKNDTEVVLDVPAKIVDGRTLVPLRFVGEALGANVIWEAATETIVITSAATPTENKPVEPATPEETGNTENPSEPVEPSKEETTTPEKPVATTPFEEYLNTLPFDPAPIMGKNREAQFVITGENAGNYAVLINDGKITWTKGFAKTPAITVTTTEKVWLDATKRIIDPTQAIMEGKITADGDLPFFVDIKDAFIVKKTQ